MTCPSSSWYPSTLTATRPCPSPKSQTLPRCRVQNLRQHSPMATPPLLPHTPPPATHTRTLSLFTPSLSISRSFSIFRSLEYVHVCVAALCRCIKSRVCPVGSCWTRRGPSLVHRALPTVPKPMRRSARQSQVRGARAVAVRRRQAGGRRNASSRSRATPQLHSSRRSQRSYGLCTMYALPICCCVHVYRLCILFVVPTSLL